MGHLPWIHGGPPFGTAPTKAPAGAFFYEPRVTRGDVVHLSLSRRDTASDSEAACGLRTATGGMPIGIPYHYICTLGMKLRDMWAMMAWYLSFLLVG